MSGHQKIIALQLICTNTNCFYKIIVAKLLAFLRISTIFTLYITKLSVMSCIENKNIYSSNNI